jgi:hypothetical protein
MMTAMVRTLRIWKQPDEIDPQSIHVFLNGQIIATLNLTRTSNRKCGACRIKLGRGYAPELAPKIQSACHVLAFIESPQETIDARLRRRSVRNSNQQF